MQGWPNRIKDHLSSDTKWSGYFFLPWNSHERLLMGAGKSSRVIWYFCIFFYFVPTYLLLSSTLPITPLLLGLKEITGCIVQIRSELSSLCAWLSGSGQKWLDFLMTHYTREGDGARGGGKDSTKPNIVKQLLTGISLMISTFIPLLITFARKNKTKITTSPCFDRLQIETKC